MSDYQCFKCGTLTHTSELIETSVKGLELMCESCFMEMMKQKQSGGKSNENNSQQTNSEQGRGMPMDLTRFSQSQNKTADFLLPMSEVEK